MRDGVSLSFRLGGMSVIDKIQSSSSYPSYLLYSSTPNHTNAAIVLYFHRHCAVQLRCNGTNLMEPCDIKGLDP